MINSCKKSKLDLLPHGPTEESYFTKEDDFTKAVLGVYAKMTDFFWYNAGSPAIQVFLLPGDDITTNDNNEPFETFGPLQPSDGSLEMLYAAHYQMIARANVVLEKVEAAASDVYKTPNLQSYHKGEALFLRGYAFYNLWNLFGTSPLVTERVTNDAQFTPPGTIGTELLDQAIQDFTDAAGLLPASWDATNAGRVTANSANGMLGKALVFRASVSGGNAADYTAAIAAFNKYPEHNYKPNLVTTLPLIQKIIQNHFLNSRPHRHSVLTMFGFQMILIMLWVRYLFSGVFMIIIMRSLDGHVFMVPPNCLVRLMLMIRVCHLQWMLPIKL